MKNPDKTDVDNGLSETIPLKRDLSERLRFWLRHEIDVAEDDIKIIILMPPGEARSLALARMTARREALVQALDRLG